MKVDLEFTYEGTVSYDDEDFPALPRVGDKLYFSDAEEKIEMAGEVRDVFWRQAKGQWRPIVTVAVTNMFGDDGDINEYWDRGETGAGQRKNSAIS